jgi:hypothetical protein
MKYLKLTLIILLALSIKAMGQNELLLPKFYKPLDSTVVKQNKQEDKVDFGMSMGTGFSTGSGYSMMNSYIAPNVSFKVSSDLQLNFQGVVSNYNTNPFGNTRNTTSPEMFKGTANNSQSFAFSGGGIYQPNDKFYISAQGQVAENPMQPFSLYPTQNRDGLEYKSFSVGMGYKISENTHINFQIGFQDNKNSFYNPYYSPFSSYNRTFDPFSW